MEKENALDLMKEISIMSGQINKMIELSKKIQDEKERKYYIKEIAKLMDILSFSMMGPIIKEYPDLDPDKEYFENSKKK